MPKGTRDYYPPAADCLLASPLADGLHTARLANGTRVIIREDHRGGVAVCNVWVRVGSNLEPEPLRGWSHGIEHMLFKGTVRRAEGDFAREVAAAGGSTNAGTGYESTNYHITVPGENLPVAIDLLADALFASTFEPASLDAERQVLVHENHMYDDIPFGFGVTWRWGCELSFDRSPYRHPIGGRDENLLERGRDDILAFWRSAYRPDRMTVVVVGDVDPAAAFAQVRLKFGQVDPGLFVGPEDPRALVPAPATEPPHGAPRLKIAYGDIKKAYVKLIFPAPGESEGLDPVLNVVRRVLGDGRSCRLYRRIQEADQLVEDFAVMTETGLREGIVLIDLETSPPRVAAALRGVCRILEELKSGGCTVTELQRAITRVSRSFLFGAETVQGQASNLGHNDLSDDLAGAFTYPAEVAAVTSADVRAFADNVFRRDGLGVVVYLPEGTDAAACGIPVEAAGLQDLLAGDLSTRTPAAWTRPASARTETAPGRATNPRRNPRFRTAELANGVEVCYRVDPSLPILTMSLTHCGGATAETAVDAGLAALTQAVQVKGAGGLDAEALHAALEGEGASLSPQADRDYGGLYLSALSGRLDRAFELLGATIHDPAFVPAEIEQERRLALEQLAAVADNPVQSAALRLRRLMYGDHPYGRPLVGTEASLPGLLGEDLRRHHERNWTADRLRVVASGDFDPDDLLARLEAILSRLPLGTGTDRPELPLITRPEGIVAERIDKQQNQSVVLAAWPGSLEPERDRVPLMLLKEVLNGQAGRLFESLRNRRSLCYNTGVASTAGFGQGLFMGYVLTAPESAAEAREELVREIAGLREAAVPPVEFERARAELLGHMLIGSQSNASRVTRAARDRLYGRAANHLEELVELVRQCPASAVQDTAARLLDPDHRFEVVLGPPSA